MVEDEKKDSNNALKKSIADAISSMPIQRTPVDPYRGYFSTTPHPFDMPGSAAFPPNPYAMLRMPYTTPLPGGGVTTTSPTGGAPRSSAAAAATTTTAATTTAAAAAIMMRSPPPPLPSRSPRRSPPSSSQQEDSHQQTEVWSVKSEKEDERKPPTPKRSERNKRSTPQPADEDHATTTRPPVSPQAYSRAEQQASEAHLMSEAEQIVVDVLTTKFKRPIHETSSGDDSSRRHPPPSFMTQEDLARRYHEQQQQSREMYMGGGRPANHEYHMYYPSNKRDEAGGFLVSKIPKLDSRGNAVEGQEYVADYYSSSTDHLPPHKKMRYLPSAAHGFSPYFGYNAPSMDFRDSASRASGAGRSLLKDGSRAMMEQQSQPPPQGTKTRIAWKTNPASVEFHTLAKRVLEDIHHRLNGRRPHGGRALSIFNADRELCARMGISEKIKDKIGNHLRDIRNGKKSSPVNFLTPEMLKVLYPNDDDE